MVGQTVHGTGIHIVDTFHKLLNFITSVLLHNNSSNNNSSELTSKP